MKKILNIITVAALIFFTGCEENYLERVPTTSITDADLFKTVVGAQTALEGIHRSTYTFGNAHDQFGQKSIDLAMDVLGEDCYQTERGYGWFVSWYQWIDHRNINAVNLEYVWSYYYDIIDNANIILQNVDNASDAAFFVTKVHNIKAQALAYRAFSYYQLVQLYATRYVPGGPNAQLGVPLVLVPTQEGLPRSTVAQVYTQINTDINASITEFGLGAVSRANKSELNVNIAQGIKARIALTTGDYVAAATAANAARTGYLPTLDNESGMNSSSDQEWIWGAVLIDEQQTSYASFFSHIDPSFGGYATLGNQKCLSTAVYDFMSATDERKAMFKDDSPTKLRVGYKFTGWGEWTNDYLYMKAGEMYLIEAEALARQGGQDAAAQDVLFTLISTRDPGYVKSVNTGTALIDEILMHRRADLWGEGFRFLDLKRLNLALDRTNLGHTASLWNAAGYFAASDKNFTFLIPKQEMDANPQMVQNDL